MWHHTQYRGEELLVLGYNARNNDCMLVRLSSLPMNEASDLRRIASSTSGQGSNYLIPILQKREAPNGQDWFSYLCRKMEQRNPPVFTLPMKEVQDALDTDQKAIFKGYGKGRINRSLEIQQRGDAYSDIEREDAEYAPQFGAEPAEQAQQAPQTSAIERKLDQLADSTRQTNAVLNKLVDVLLADKAPAPKKPTPKARSQPRKKADKPDLTKLGHNQGPPLEMDERI